jgi:hypothetical protein
MSDRQARVIAKLRELGDPDRNPDEAEAKAAREKHIDLLYQCGIVHDSVELDVGSHVTEEQLRETLQKLVPSVDCRWLKITVEDPLK